MVKKKKVTYYTIKCIDKRTDVWIVMGPGIVNKGKYQSSWYCDQEMAEDEASLLNFAISFGMSLVLKKQK